MRWYMVGGIFSLAGIACTIVGDKVNKREAAAEAWDEATAKKADDGVHGVSGE